jgi:hypothetical protein
MLSAVEEPMENHETRRKIIRQWMSLPKDKRQTAEQAAASPRKRSRRTNFSPAVVTPTNE